MSLATDRAEALKEALSRRVLCLDGAMGTALQAAKLTDADFGGPALAGCNENLNRTRPDVIRALRDHEAVWVWPRAYRCCGGRQWVLEASLERPTGTFELVHAADGFRIYATPGLAQPDELHFVKPGAHFRATIRGTDYSSPGFSAACRGGRR